MGEVWPLAWDDLFLLFVIFLVIFTFVFSTVQKYLNHKSLDRRTDRFRTVTILILTSIPFLVLCLTATQIYLAVRAAEIGRYITHDRSEIMRIVRSTLEQQVAFNKRIENVISVRPDLFGTDPAELNDKIEEIVTNDLQQSLTDANATIDGKSTQVPVTRYLIWVSTISIGIALSVMLLVYTFATLRKSSIPGTVAKFGLTAAISGASIVAITDNDLTLLEAINFDPAFELDFSRTITQKVDNLIPSPNAIDCKIAPTSIGYFVMGTAEHEGGPNAADEQAEEIRAVLARAETNRTLAALVLFGSTDGRPYRKHGGNAALARRRVLAAKEWLLNAYERKDIPRPSVIEFNPEVGLVRWTADQTERLSGREVMVCALWAPERQPSVAVNGQAQGDRTITRTAPVAATSQTTITKIRHYSAPQ